MKNLLLSLLLILTTATKKCQQPVINADTFIQQVNIVDVFNEKIISNQTIAIEGDKII